MRKKELLNRWKIPFRHLMIIDMFEEEFIHKLGGEKALSDWIDDILDEINWVDGELKKIENK